MYENHTDNDLDLRRVMKSIAQLNPNVSLSDIAFLMDAPYEPEICEYDMMDTIETP
ncbi:MAG: hypothetical protein ACE5DZ_06465 [Mariprofundus sp.]